MGYYYFDRCPEDKTDDIGNLCAEMGLEEGKCVPPARQWTGEETNVCLVDYRFLCFDGKPKVIFVDIETASNDGTHNSGARRNVYDSEFNYLEQLKVKREKFDPTLIKKPENFNEMKKYAEKLSEPFVFCRVDLYNVSGKIYFGEITFYPGGGTQILTPEEWELKMGDWIDLKSKKIVVRNKS